MKVMTVALTMWSIESSRLWYYISACSAVNGVDASRMNEIYEAEPKKPPSQRAIALPAIKITWCANICI